MVILPSAGDITRRSSTDGQLRLVNQVYLTRFNRPVGCLACPCGFEPQTYALEAVKVSLNNKLDNGIKLLKSGVQYTPRILVSSGTAWI